MVFDHVWALTQFCLMMLVLAVSYGGWGVLVVQALGVTSSSCRSVPILIWMGWALTLVLFQLLHLFVALTAYAVVPVFLAGLLYAMYRLVRRIREGNNRCYCGRRPIILLILALAAIGWIASRSMLEPQAYDSGLYHLSAIRWINSYAIVPGLGNLHGRLGFNQSFFTYVAALNFYPYFNQGRSIANTFLLMLTIATCVSFLKPVFERRGILTESHPFLYVPAILILPLLAYQTLRSGNLASPSPDLASIVLQLTLFMMLARYLLAVMEVDRQAMDEWGAIILILAISAITMKLSNFAFATALSAGIVLTRVRPAYRACSMRTAIGTGLCVLAILVVWGIQGFVLAGMPLYPSTVGYMPVDWAVPRSQAVGMSLTVTAWARQAHKPANEVLGNWDWLAPWADHMRKKAIEAAYPMALAVILGLLAMGTYFGKRQKTKHPLAEWAVIFPVWAGLLGWFVLAPDLRFAHAQFWCLSFGSALIFLSHMKPAITAKAYSTTFWAVFLIVNVLLIGKTFDSIKNLADVSLSGWHPVPVVPLNTMKTASGLVVYTPKTGDQCWDAPLPCTPDFNPNLRLRIADDLASGFTVFGPDKVAD